MKKAILITCLLLAVGVMTPLLWSGLASGSFTLADVFPVIMILGIPLYILLTGHAPAGLAHQEEFDDPASSSAEESITDGYLPGNAYSHLFYDGE